MDGWMDGWTDGRTDGRTERTERERVGVRNSNRKEKQ